MSVSPPQSTSLEVVEAVKVIPSTIREHASYIHPQTIIEERDQWIYFPAGKANETLLEIPIGRVGRDDTIVITVGLFKDWYNQPGVDLDPKVGISDSKGNYNLFEIYDINDYYTVPPCKLIGIRQPNTLVSEGTKVSATYNLMFFPRDRYGVCKTAQDNGFLQQGLFRDDLDITELYLHVERDDSYESYFFRYFKIEVLTYHGNTE